MISVFLQRQAMEFEIGIKKFRLDFPSNLVENFQIKNELDFATLVKNFLMANKIWPDKLQIILKDQVLFTKEFKKIGESREDIDRFYGEIPFKEKNLAKVEVAAADTILAIAANNEVFEFLARILSNMEFEVVGVYPEVVMLDKNFKKMSMLWYKNKSFKKNKWLVLFLIAFIIELIIFAQFTSLF